MTITYRFRPWLGTRYGDVQERTARVIGPRNRRKFWPIGGGVWVHEGAITEVHDG